MLRACTVEATSIQNYFRSLTEQIWQRHVPAALASGDEGDNALGEGDQGRARRSQKSRFVPPSLITMGRRTCGREMVPNGSLEKFENIVHSYF